ncbi:uncharacterized protein N7484_006753 [Penicillium longicatenatum]|uniref:uncharacterized protein n=1 Tax=Penicillium longicatenatum TaxID=1561947 RepID=UPI0025475295|nr:uncharacterized protein N7484_006753 [Penicillium longicatenatum]KAJ5644246.1 hypothetical protein N7484_006753 [Penicillium longicatenatum]
MPQQIPPVGFPFRIFFEKKNKFLAAEDDVALVDPDVQSDNQLFVLGESPSKQTSDMFMIESFKCGRALQLDKNSKKLTLAELQPSYDGQWFSLTGGTGNSKDLLSAGPKSPAAIAIGDAIFIIDFSRGDVDVAVTYDLKVGKISQTTPAFIASQTVKNDSDATQTPSVNLSATKTVTKSFTYSMGFQITIGTKFRAGVPSVAEGEISSEISHHQDFEWGTATTEGTTVGYSVPVTAPPHSKVKATAVAKTSVIDVPAKIRFSSRRSSTFLETDIVYRGTTYWDFNVTYENV